MGRKASKGRGSGQSSASGSAQPSPRSNTENQNNPNASGYPQPGPRSSTGNQQNRQNADGSAQPSPRPNIITGNQQNDQNQNQAQAQVPSRAPPTYAAQFNAPVFNVNNTQQYLTPINPRNRAQSNPQPQPGHGQQIPQQGGAQDRGKQQMTPQQSGQDLGRQQIQQDGGQDRGKEQMIHRKSGQQILQGSDNQIQSTIAMTTAYGGPQPDLRPHFPQPPGEPPQPLVYNSPAQSLAEAVQQSAPAMMQGAQSLHTGNKTPPSGRSRRASATTQIYGGPSTPPMMARADQQFQAVGTQLRSARGSTSSPSPAMPPQTPARASASSASAGPSTALYAAAATHQSDWPAMPASSSRGSAAQGGVPKVLNRAFSAPPSAQAPAPAPPIANRAFGQAHVSIPAPQAEEGQPGERPANFGDQQVINPAQHTPFAGQVEAADAAGQAQASWLRFVSQRCQNVLRITQENDPERGLRELANSLSKYRDSHRGRHAILPVRPAVKSRLSKQENIFANHFKVHFRDRLPMCIVYSVTWHTRRKVLKADKMRMWNAILSIHGADPLGINGVLPVYDGTGVAITPRPFGFPQDVINSGARLNLNDGNSLILKFKENVDFGRFFEFLNSTQSEVVFPKSVIIALNMIMKQYCVAKDYIESGRFHFARDQRDCTFTMDLLDSMPGYFQSVRVLHGGLTMNVDVMTTAFYKPNQPLAKVWTTMLDGNYLPDVKKRLFQDRMPPRAPWSPDQVSVLREYWRNLEIKSDHRRQVDREIVPFMPKTFTIYDVMTVPANRQPVDRKFNHHPRNWDSLIEFLRDVYYVTNTDALLGELPALKISKKNTYYLPWGSCRTAEGARYGGKLEKRNLLDRLAKPPGQRCGAIQDWMNTRYCIDEQNNQQRNYLWAETGFGVNVNVQMMAVTALMLKAPKMVGGKDSELKPNGEAPLVSFPFAHTQEFLTPALINSWAVLTFGSDSSIPQLWVDSLCNDIVRTANLKGMTMSKAATMNRRLEVNVLDNNDDKRRNVSNALDWIMQYFPAALSRPGGQGNFDRRGSRPPQIHAADAAAAKPDLIICVMRSKMHPEYATLKYICDKVYGVPTQVVILSNKLFNTPRGALPTALILNVLYKINVKCGGFNFEFHSEAYRSMPLLSQTTIMLGADVTHPPGGDSSLPSIAAVVATTDHKFVNYACRIRPQPGNREVIQDLQEMVRQLLLVYQKSEGELPSNILFFRDGISETQYITTLREEGIAILEGARSIAQGYDPRLFIILAVKRHHTRFFYVERGIPADNIWAGTVIDNEVTHPREYDFYLCSQNPGKGTSRATHYHVLLDQINILPDELYSLVFNLCHTYQRCTKAVSLVTPVFYAHLAAFRARHYMEYYVAQRKSDHAQGIHSLPDPLNADFDAHADLQDRLWFL